MTSEISDCTAPTLEWNSDSSLEPTREVPKGLAAVRDSIQLPPRAPKPNFIERALLSIGLLFFHLVTWTVQLTNWILKTFFGYASNQKVLYRELHHIAKKGDVNEIREFLTTHATKPNVAGYLFKEFLDMPEIYLHLPEILMGANVCFCKDEGFFLKRWKEHPEAYQRISSHRYQGNHCYAIGHFLFWLDLDGNTRFQFEKSPLRGFFTTINHTIDYLRYRRDNEQQGVTGSSPHTEQYCLCVPVIPRHFLLRQISHDD